MGVLWVRQEWTDRGGNNAGLLNEQETLSWLIKTDDKTMEAQEVYLGAAASLPERFDAHPGDVLGILTCRSFSMKNLSESPYFWRATFQYDSQPLTQKEQQERDDPSTFASPLDRPPVIRVVQESFEEPVVEDLDSHAILNSANDPYPDPIVRPRTRKRYDITYNGAAIPSWHDDLEGMLNNASVTIIKGGTSTVYPTRALLFIPGGISELKEEAGVEYMEISFSLLHRRETWRRKLLDEGYNYLDSGVKRKIMVKDADDEDVEPTDPQLLDGSGGILASPSPSTAVYNTFDVDEEGDFSSLPVDDS